MKTDSYDEAPRHKGASPNQSSSAKANRPAPGGSYPQWPALEEVLQSLPESRPGAVERAKALIADCRFPSDEETELLAQHLAAELTTETDWMTN